MKGSQLILFIVLITQHLFAQDYQPSIFFNHHDGGITTLISNRDKTLLVAGDSKGKIYLYDLTTNKLLKKIDAHTSPIANLKFNSNENLLISSTIDGEIKIYDFAKSQIIQSIYSPDYSGINFVLFSIADGFIYFNGNNKLYKTRSDLSQKVELIFEQTDSLYDAVITSNRNSLIFTCGNSIRILNTRTDHLKQEIKRGSVNIIKLAMINDSVLVSWSADGSIAFWKYLLDQLSYEPYFTLKAGQPSTMNFSKSGKLMCSGNVGNWARIWKLESKEIVQELFLHKAPVTSSIFGLTDDILFTGSLDGSIIKWQKGKVTSDSTFIQPIKILSTVAAPTAVIPSTPNGIKMAEGNIPSIIYGRSISSTELIQVNTPTINVNVYDNNYIDGDTMSLFFNGTWIVDHYGVTKKKHAISLNLLENTNNYLVLFANNLGKSPPNTAALEFDYNGKKFIYKLSSDLKTCSAINFIYKK